MYHDSIAGTNRNNYLESELWAYPSGSHELIIRLWIAEDNTREEHFKGSLNELIELILLGKLHKEQLQAMDKKESVLQEVATRLTGESISASGIRELQDNG